MLPANRRRLRLWLVAPLLLLALLFGIDAVYGQPGRPPVPPGGIPGGNGITGGPTTPGVLPGGITPAGGSGPGPNGAGNPGAPPTFPGPAGGPGNPALPPTPPNGPVNPGFPQPPAGFPGAGGFVGNPGAPNIPNFPGPLTPPNPGGGQFGPQPPAGFPNNPGTGIPPAGFPPNPGIGTTRTCTCSKCKGTFPVSGNANPTHCALCGAKFDIVTGNPAGGMFPNGVPGGMPNGFNPGPFNPPGGPTNPDAMTPPNGMFPPQINNPPAFTPPQFNNPSNFPTSPDNSAPQLTAAKTGITVFAIVVGVGLLLLGVLLIGGVVTFVLIYRGVSSASTDSAPRPRRQRRSRNYDD